MSNPHNSAQIHCSNIRVLLDSIRRNGPISKRDLQKMTGMSWGTVSSLTGELLDQGYVILSGKQITNVGRRPEKLDINNTDFYIVGIDLNLSGLCAVVTDLRGRIIREWIRVISDNTYDCVMNTLFSLLDEILLRDYADKTILGIGIAMQGLVDVNNGVAQRMPQVRHWKDVPLKTMIEERYGRYTHLMHDPNCLMIAERAYGTSLLATAKDAVLLRLDSGIGMSIMSNGRIHVGSGGKAGEIGHIPVNPDGPVCSCGNRGCLEEYASGNALIRRFIERVDQGGQTEVNAANVGSIGYRGLALAARGGDALCMDLFRQMGDYLGLALSILFNIFNPEVVVLYGDLTAYRDLFSQPMQERLDAHLYSGIPAKLVFSEQGRHAAAQGAALAVSDHLLETKDFSMPSA